MRITRDFHIMTLYSHADKDVFFLLTVLLGYSPGDDRQAVLSHAYRQEQGSNQGRQGVSYILGRT